MKFLRLPMLWIAIVLALSACGGKQESVVASQVGGAVQGKSLALSRTVTTLAGPTPGVADGTGSLAKFERPTSLASDGVNIYIADSDNHTIRKMVIATGEVTTLAGKPGVLGSADGTGSAARFYAPSGIATDGSNLYVTDSMNYTIRKIVIATAQVTTVAGSAGSRDYWNGTEGVHFGWLRAIATDGVNLYVVDDNSIRKVVLATGAVTTLVGGPLPYGSTTTTTTTAPAITDGTAPAVTFGYVSGIATDGTDLFFIDGRTIRKMAIATGEVTTLAGDESGYNYGVRDGVGAGARFADVAGITSDGTSLYVCDSNTIRKIVIATAQVSTLAGEPWQDGFADGAGSVARFCRPQGIVAAGAGLFVADTANRLIRKVAIATGAVTTVAGAPATGSADGPAATALFFNPRGITTDGRSLFVADTGNCTIRKIELATGSVSTLAGTPGKRGFADGTGPAARFLNIIGITTDGTNLYVTDYPGIRKVEIATGVVTTLFGGGLNSVTANDNLTTIGQLGDITTDGTNLFAVDNLSIRKIVIATGAVTTLAGSTTGGWADRTGGDATFGWIGGITTDGTSLFVADSGNGLIRKVTIATGEVTTLAGRPMYWGSMDGYASDATFASPQGITTDGTSLYIADVYNHSIRKLVLATGEVTTLVGSASRSTSKDGVGAAAGLAAPAGLTTDGRSLYVTDGIGLIRRID